MSKSFHQYQAEITQGIQMGDDNLAPSINIRALFDDQIREVTKYNELIPFSVDIILTDLIQAGISTLDALDILHKIRPYLYPAINTVKIIQLLNQAIQDQGYIEGEFLYGSFLQPILIEFPDNRNELFNFRIIKDIVKDYLVEFIYSSKTFRAAVDELHRIIKSLRTSKIKSDTIEKMLPAVMRNTIGVNPFSRTRCDEDYHIVNNLTRDFHKLWHSLPEPERPSMLRNLYEASFKVILLSFEYLPGSTFSNTVHQIQELVADLAQRTDLILSAKEVYTVGKIAKTILEIHKEPNKLQFTDEHEIIDATETVVEVVHGLMNRGVISWIVVTDAVGNELYSKFLSPDTKETAKSLIAMAISGIQSIVNELTDNAIKEIQQEEGNKIIIEKRKYFSVMALVRLSSHLVRQRIIELTDFIELNLNDHIINFKGSVNHFHNTIEPFVTEKLYSLIFNPIMKEKDKNK
ncbi:MAG: hypothetical protein ACXAD7_09495 [Candidatus Kariarchaeaceae archaeon]|jgi:hypothetical protein